MELRLAEWACEHQHPFKPVVVQALFNLALDRGVGYRYSYFEIKRVVERNYRHDLSEPQKRVLVGKLVDAGFVAREGDSPSRGPLYVIRLETTGTCLRRALPAPGPSRVPGRDDDPRL